MNGLSKYAARPVRFAGYAALFDHPDGAGDIIRRGAFIQSLTQATGPIPLLWQHRPDHIIGHIDYAAEDARGLRVTATITSAESMAAQMLIRKAVTGLSFGYRARGFYYNEDKRILEDIALFEVSLVTHPLQPNARVHATA